MCKLLRLHSLLTASQVNGPGSRAVVWLQGCSLACPGCFNPATHDPLGGETIETDILAERLLAANPDGVSLSGGEPFQQTEGVLELVEILRGHRPEISLLAFTGYSLPRLRRTVLGPSILRHLDVLIAGPYVSALHVGQGLLGSANQTIHLLSPRHRLEHLAELPDMEIRLNPDGTVIYTGMSGLL